MEDRNNGARTIVVALDESEHSFYGLNWALKTLLPPSSTDNIILLHANALPTAIGNHGYMLNRNEVSHLELSNDKRIREFMERALKICQEWKVNVEAKVESGDPRYVICEMTDKLKADMLVLGNHGYGAIKRMMLGSISDYCSHHAKCPVVIVKNPHKKHPSDT